MLVVDEVLIIHMHMGEKEELWNFRLTVVM